MSEDAAKSDYKPAFINKTGELERTSVVVVGAHNSRRFAL
jgi:hypothetical protein